MTVWLLYGQDKAVSSWFSDKMEGLDFGLNTSIGIMKDSSLIGAALYNNYIVSPKGVPVSIEISLLTYDKAWCKRSIIKEFFVYPFIQLGVKRLQTTISVNNKSSKSFLEKIGFVFEGIGREAWPLGGDCAVYSMLRNECKWLENGKISS